MSLQTVFINLKLFGDYVMSGNLHEHQKHISTYIYHLIHRKIEQSQLII